MSEPRTATTEALRQVEAGLGAKLRRVGRRFPLAREVAALFRFVRDKDVSLSAKSAAVLALLYFISPVDAVPDAIPVAGLLDDALVIMGVVASLATSLLPYRRQPEVTQQPEHIIDVKAEVRARD